MHPPCQISYNPPCRRESTGCTLTAVISLTHTSMWYLRLLCYTCAQRAGWVEQTKHVSDKTASAKEISVTQCARIIRGRHCALESLTLSLFQQLSLPRCKFSPTHFLPWWKIPDVAEHFMHNAAIENGEKLEKHWERLIAAWTLARKNAPQMISLWIYSSPSSYCWFADKHLFLLLVFFVACLWCCSWWWWKVHTHRHTHTHTQEAGLELICWKGKKNK